MISPGGGGGDGENKGNPWEKSQKVNSWQSNSWFCTHASWLICSETIKGLTWFVVDETCYLECFIYQYLVLEWFFMEELGGVPGLSICGCASDEWVVSVQATSHRCRPLARYNSHEEVASHSRGESWKGQMVPPEAWKSPSFLPLTWRFVWDFPLGLSPHQRNPYAI